MSPKTPTIDTKEEAKPTLVPKLRFPEFRGARPWTVEVLSDVAEFINEKISLEQIELNNYVSTENLLPDYRGVTRASKLPTTGSLTRFRPNDTLVSNIRPYLKKVWFSNKDGGASNDVIVIRAKSKLLITYLPFLLKNDSFIDYVMTGAKGVKMPRGDIDSMKKYPIFFPAPAEQQKIADCLNSVDELIAAHARKVDALKTHKKGLMQQLFPREGETQPRLRFPEFQDAGDWEDLPFSDLCDIKHGYAFESEFFSNEGDFVLLTPGNFYEQGGYRDRGEQQKYYSGEIPRDYVLVKGDMLVAMTEQAAGLLGSPILVPESSKFLHNQRLGLVARKPGVAWASEFFFYVFNTQRVRKAIHDTASGAKVRHTSPTKIGLVAIAVPTSLPEQQRIASCLTSLDDLITAQTQQLATLTTHKKGLMQQLFPVGAEV